MSPSRYHPTLVVLHWLLAFMVIFSLGMGTFALTALPNDSPDKLFALGGHMVAGLLILTFMVIRFAVRSFTQKPQPASTGNPLLDKIAVLNHYALYLLVILMAASGIATSVQAGLPDIVFGGSGAPLPDSFAIYTPRVAHGIIAKLLLAIVALHALAALYHQFVRKDNLLARMWFGQRSG